MEKKDLILTVAKDILVAYKVMPENRVDREETIKDLGSLLSSMVKQVERVYDDMKL